MDAPSVPLNMLFKDALEFLERAEDLIEFIYYIEGHALLLWVDNNPYKPAMALNLKNYTKQEATIILDRAVELYYHLIL